MPEFAPRDVLSRVATATKKNLTDWNEGVSLAARSNKTVEDLRHRVTSDRLGLATECRRRARKLVELKPPMYRDAISRYYYCLYHTFRAVAYYVTPGDDSQEHKTLPGAIPDSFPDADAWRNRLKTARLARNNADYNAYPKAERAWRQDCDQLAEYADEVIGLARSYLTNKGCVL